MRENYKKAFETLHLDPHADKEAIRLAYKKRVQKLHPDRNDENDSAERKQEFQDVLDAYKLINDAIKAGELARDNAAEARASKKRAANEQTDKPRPVRATPKMRQHFTSDSFYGTRKRTSAVTFVMAVAVIAIVIAVVFAIIGAQQSSQTPTRQWDPAYHENKALGRDTDAPADSVEPGEPEVTLESGDAVDLGEPDVSVEPSEPETSEAPGEPDDS